MPVGHAAGCWQMRQGSWRGTGIIVILAAYVRPRCQCLPRTALAQILWSIPHADIAPSGYSASCCVPCGSEGSPKSAHFMCVMSRARFSSRKVLTRAYVELPQVPASEEHLSQKKPGVMHGSKHCIFFMNLFSALQDLTYTYRKSTHRALEHLLTGFQASRAVMSDLHSLGGLWRSYATLRSLGPTWAASGLF